MIAFTNNKVSFYNCSHQVKYHTFYKESFQNSAEITNLPENMCVFFFSLVITIPMYFEVLDTEYLRWLNYYYEQHIKK